MLCRYTKARFKGKEMYLAFTVNAMFQITDMLGDGEEIMDVMEGKGAGGFVRFCEAVSILAGCGAQAAEADGHPRPAVPGAEELCACMQPAEYIGIKRETLKAVLLGYGQEITDEEEETDIGLAELEKKEDPPGHLY